MSTAILRDISLLHPIVVPAFTELQDRLNRAFRAGDVQILFRPFETYRSPSRQLALTKQKPIVTKAMPWQSAHQYGLAADFVGVTAKGEWTWDLDLQDWDFLTTQAEFCGLEQPIGWDRPHIQAPCFEAVRNAYRRPSIITK